MRDNPDAIHFDWNYRYFIRRNYLLTILNVPLFLMEVWFCRLVGCTIVWTMHNLEDHQMLFPNIEKFVLRKFARSCQWIRVFSDSTIKRAATYLNISERKFKVVPEGSYIDYYHNNISKQQARTTLGIPENSLVFLYFGGIKKYKGILEAIDTFFGTRAKHWVLVIAGRRNDVDYSEALARKVGDSSSVFLFDRFIDKDQVQVFFNACDLVLLPFKQIENSGSVNLAMGFRKPIITPRMGILPEKLKHQDVLLYNQDLAEVLRIIPDLTEQQLTAWGMENYKKMVKQSWNSFGQLFTN